MPIVGRGDIASVLIDNEELLFFVSGVSNSQETNEDEYEREERLLLQQRIDAHVVYCGSLCVFTSDTRYARHKKRMESIVRAQFRAYTILRLGNITWGTNPHTLINFLRNAHENGEPYVIQDTYRYIVDKEEFLYWVNLIPNRSCEMNITGKRMKVVDVFKTYCLKED